MFGALGVGFLAKAGITGEVNGLLYGNASQLGYQALSVVAAFAYSFIVTFVLLKLVDALVGLRVTTEEEEVGLDLTQHGERGYIMGIGELLVGLPAQDPLAQEMVTPRTTEVTRPHETTVGV